MEHVCKPTDMRIDHEDRLYFTGSSFVPVYTCSCGKEISLQCNRVNGETVRGWFEFKGN